jgi:hypothetical protein
MGGAIKLNPALHNFYLLPVVPMLVIVIQQCVNIFRPQWLWFRALFMLASDLMTFAILAGLSSHRPYLLLVETAKNAPDYARAVPAINQIISLSLLAIAIGVGIAAIVHLVQTVREIRRFGKAGDSSVMQISASL